MPRQRHFIFRDATLLLASCLLAVVLAEGGWLEAVLHHIKGAGLIGSFVGGLFFTSVFTTVPAIVFLGEVAQQNSLVVTALIGASGSVLGDLLIFRFVRDSVSEDLVFIRKKLQRYSRWRRFTALIFHRHFFKLRFWRYVVPLVGALIIVSPFPDELGLTILGLSKIKTSTMIPLTFVFNFIGILCVGLVARAI